MVHDANDKKLDSKGAFLTFFKSLFGAGLLSLPNVLGRVGLPLGVGIYSLVGSGCAFSCYLLLRARQVTLQQEHVKHHLVTYGDLADLLFGPTLASVTRWTIVVLNIFFTSGLIIVICENLTELLSEWQGTAGQQEYRMWVGLGLLPLVVLVIQIPWLQDMWFISVMGLAVYTVGVIGSTLFSALWTITSSNDVSLLDDPSRGIPDDLWAMNWMGIPSFIGTAVYALEGINLALPTAHSMQTDDATQVVCRAVLGYTAVTIVFAAIGYAGGLGGGPGTGLTPEECDVVTNCISPPFLKWTIQLALSVAMTFSIPVMLYPSTEMLEVMLTDWQQQKEQQQNKLTAEQVALVSAKEESTIYGTTTSCSNAASSKEANAKDQHFSQTKSWKLRVFLAMLTVTMGSATKSFTNFSGLVGAVGLSFAGFILPPLLYYRAMEQANLLPLSCSMKGAMILLGVFGSCNMLVGGASSFLGLWNSFS